MHTSVVPAHLKIIDLFAGPGGLDVAARALGIPVTGIEWDSDACATRLAAGLLTEQGDVRKYGPKSFPTANVLAGGPPCQTYTVAGNGTGRRALDQVLDLAKRMAKGDIEAVITELAKEKDPRTGLVLEPLRWALQALELERPYQLIVLEQVPAVLPVWQEFRDILITKGYSAICDVLHTEEFGVPQTRRRAILVARYVGDSESALRAEVELPKATHRRYHKRTKDSNEPSKLDRWVTMGNALNRTGPFVVVSNYGTGGDPKLRGQRRSDEPAFTVTGKVSRNKVVMPYGTPFPPPLDRLTEEEAGRLQTFPATFPWSGRAVSQQIGNAIPPRLGIHVLAAALGLDNEQRDTALALLPQLSFPHCAAIDGAPVEPDTGE
ncbi:DNA cytosine methyltransferase [Kitasatospora sp. NPDC058965]|uniref:DNA cytosine methyltransferase n=1 Tax=Kitasatospora sp. NPDC058965 TaxID=3346682 RepID=UPI003696FA48